MKEYNIISINEIETVKRQMKRINEGNFKPFVAEVISWYQIEALHSITASQDKDIGNPPNIFNLFYYTNRPGENVLNYFGNSLELQTSTSHDVNEMMHDVVSVLNGYHLFFYHQDDSFPQKKYFNDFVKEIW